MEWSKHSVGNIRRQLEEKTRELIKAELAATSGAESNMVRVIQAEVNELLEKECLMWQQRARSLFLKSRDCNTCYFHQRASHRYKRNRILGLKSNNGAWCTSDQYIKEIVVSFYERLFTSSHPSAMDVVLEVVEPKVMDSMN